MGYEARLVDGSRGPTAQRILAMFGEDNIFNLPDENKEKKKEGKVGYILL